MTEPKPTLTIIAGPNGWGKSTLTSATQATRVKYKTSSSLLVTATIWQYGSTKKAMSTLIDIGTLIDSHPDIHGGRPLIAGTGVTVQRIVILYKQGLKVEEIASRIGHVNLARVYAALTYYHANQEQIEAEIAAEEAEYNRLEALHRVNKPT